MKKRYLILVFLLVSMCIGCSPVPLEPPAPEPVGLGSVLSLEDHKAVEAFLNRLHSSARSGETAAANQYNNLGVASDLRGHYAQALTYHYQALALRSTVSDGLAEAKSYNNLAVVYGRMGQMEQAMTLYVQAISLFEQAAKPHWQAHTLRNYGQTLQASHHYSAARQIYQQALQIWQTLGEQAMVEKLTADLASLPAASGKTSSEPQWADAPATMDSGSPGSSGTIRFIEEEE